VKNLAIATAVFVSGGLAGTAIGYGVFSAPPCPTPPPCPAPIVCPTCPEPDLLPTKLETGDVVARIANDRLHDCHKEGLALSSYVLDMPIDSIMQKRLKVQFDKLAAACMAIDLAILRKVLTDEVKNAPKQP
jgi:hypothetical protein